MIGPHRGALRQTEPERIGGRSHYNRHLQSRLFRPPVDPSLFAEEWRQTTRAGAGIPNGQLLPTSSPLRSGHVVAGQWAWARGTSQV